MESMVYVQRIGAQESCVYNRLRTIQKIICDSPLVERIIFNAGEIELKASETELNIFSKVYLPNGESKTTYILNKKLIPGYNPQQALKNAKNGIIQRVSDLEIQGRETNFGRDLMLYLSRVKKKQGQASNFDSQRIASDFINNKSARAA
ncbi:Uncharacterised protein [uncultured archaeon]|nr:Uncharacterised protein [uncultured archaeon]